MPEINESDLLNLNKASKKLITIEVEPVEQGGEEWNEVRFLFNLIFLTYFHSFKKRLQNLILFLHLWKEKKKRV